MGLLAGGPGLGFGNVHTSSQAAPAGPTHLANEHSTPSTRLMRLIRVIRLIRLMKSIKIRLLARGHS